MLYNRDKRGSSTQKLPPISKYVNLVEHSRKKINQLDVSLQLINQYSKPNIMERHTPKKNSSKNTKKIHSVRLRTDSVGALNANSSKASARRKSNLDYNNFENKKLQTTLQDFHRNIKINKEYIQRQIRRRYQKNNKQQKQNSYKAIKISTQSCNRSKESRDNSTQRRSRRINTEDSVIFKQIEQIICGKIPKTAEKQRQRHQLKHELNNVRNMIKMTKISKNIRNTSPYEDLSDLKRKNQQGKTNCSSRLVLKDEKNYHEWRRVDLNSNQKTPKYKLSNFQIQTQRLKQFVLKNQVNLSQYFEFKNQLYNCQTAKNRICSP